MTTDVAEELINTQRLKITGAQALIRRGLSVRAACALEGIEPEELMQLGRQCDWLPLPSEIEEQCLRIQSRWTKQEREARRC
jgi:hypothetical protein